MPDPRPIDVPTGRKRTLIIAGVAAFILAAFAFAFMINLPAGWAG